MYFNSRPHEEVDCLPFSGQLPDHHFNSRPHEEVDEQQLLTSSCAEYFNSRPHEEVDIHTLSDMPSLHYFNSRPHEEVDLGPPVKAEQPFIFQLTTSRGGRQQFHTTLRHLKLSFLCLYYIFEHFLLY